MKAITNETTRLFKRSIIVFALTIIVTLYWYLPLLISVYRFPVIGAIYEILWIFMIIRPICTAGHFIYILGKK